MRAPVNNIWNMYNEELNTLVKLGKLSYQNNTKNYIDGVEEYAKIKMLMPNSTWKNRFTVDKI